MIVELIQLAVSEAELETTVALESSNLPGDCYK